jgi:hypothetical protein
MYRVPQPYICPKCKTKTHSTEPDSVCMKCFAEFIAKHVPKVVPDPDGKPFDPSSQISYY